jgi:hypothetical protein
MTDPYQPFFDELVTDKQVTAIHFIQDYVQIQVGSDSGISANADISISFAMGVTLTRKEPGFCDALVSTIGLTVTRYHYDDDALVLYLSGGRHLHMHRDPARYGRESINFYGNGSYQGSL